MDNCIFCKIVRGEIPSRKVYEDDLVYAFHDIHPVAPVHFMLVPKEHIESMARLAQQQGSIEGFRTIVNTGRVGRQEVMHLHVHVLGGPDVLPPMLMRT